MPAYLTWFSSYTSLVSSDAVRKSLLCTSAVICWLQKLTNKNSTRARHSRVRSQCTNRCNTAVKQTAGILPQSVGRRVVPRRARLSRRMQADRT